MNNKKDFKIALISLQKDTERIPPMGLVYIATYLRDKIDLTGNNIRILDRNYTNIEKELEELKPDIIGLTSMTVEYEKSIYFAKQIKLKHKIPLIIGGVHISSLPQSLDGIFDIGVIGEGEETMKELINLYLEKKSFSTEDLYKIKGIVFWDNKEIITTQSREMIDCDTLPIPDFTFVKRDYFKKEEIPAINEIGIKCYLITSRGCPYKCVFCSTSHFWKKIRFHSPEFIAKTIKKYITDFNISYIKVLDDLFAINSQRLKEIKIAFEKYDILNKIKGIECSARVNLLNEELCKYLSALKVKTLNFGFESGSDKILKYLKQQSVSLEMNKKAILLCKKYKFNVYGSLIYGSPGETIEDMKKTNRFIDFAIKNGARYIWSFVAIPFPATPFWEIALQRKKVGNKMNWDLLDLHNIENPLLLDESIDKKDFKRIFLEGRKKLRNLKIKMITKFIFKNPLFIFMIIIKEPKYYFLRIIKQIFRQ